MEQYTYNQGHLRTAKARDDYWYVSYKQASSQQRVQHEPVGIDPIPPANRSGFSRESIEREGPTEKISSDST